MSKYPSEIDSNQELPAVVDGVSETGGESINALIAAVIAIQKALGLDPQGAAQDLTSRLAVALNDDGTIKAATLAASGLVTLPIDNDDVGASAGILESKLDLDVGTTALQSQINSNDTDIATLQDELAILIRRVSRHVLGLAERHDGYQIDVIGGLTGATTISTVGEALDFLRDTFLAHIAATDVGEHFASAITYVPQPDGAIVADNVQDAITSIEDDFIEDRRKHNDSAHSDGVSQDGYVFLGGQAAVNDASLKLSVFESSVDVMKVGHINSAVAKSKGFSAADLALATGDALTVTAQCGTSSRSLTVTGISSAAYPTASGLPNLQAVVQHLNSSFCSTANNFPVTAFESDDGEIVLQHNIDRDDCTLTISGPVGTSAVEELGFTDIENIEIGKVDIYRAHANGRPFAALKTISTGTVVHAAASSTINLGVDVGSSGLDLQPNSLLHVYNHTTGSANGTYRIVTVAASPGTTITIPTSITNGTFDYIIYEDAFQIPSGGGPRCLDFYFDENRDLITSERSETTFANISGVRIVEVSQNFPAATGASLTLSDTGGTGRTLKLTVGGSDGDTVSFETGFFGYLRVYGPDNISYITVLVNSTLALGTFVDTITFNASEAQDDRTFLGTAFSNASTVLELPMHRRNVGLVGLTAIGSEFTRGVLERDLSNLHLSGVVRGLDVSVTSTTAVTIKGGTAYVDGRFVEKETQTVTVTNIGTTAGTYNLVLDKEGNYQLYDSTTVGYTVEDLLRDDQRAVLAQVVVAAGPTVSSVTDARFFINDSESRFQLSVDTRELGAGSFKTLEAAQLYAAFAPNDTKQEITILSDLTISSEITVTANTRLFIFGDVTFAANLTVDTGAIVEAFGTVTNQDLLTLNSGATLILHNGGDFSASAGVVFNDDSTLKLGGDLSANTLTVSGNNVSILGSSNQPQITFDGSGTGLTGTGVSNLTIADVVMEMTSATESILEITDLTKMRAVRSWFRQSTIDSAGIISASRRAINLLGTSSNIEVLDCKFSNLSHGLYGNDISDSELVRNEFEDVGIGVLLTEASDMAINHNRFTTMHLNGILFDGVDDQVNGLSIKNNVFQGMFNPSAPNQSTPVPVSSAVQINNVHLEGNTVKDINNVANLFLLRGAGLAVHANIISACETSSHAIAATQFINKGSFTGNTIISHDGPLVELASFAIAGNHLDGYNGGTGAVSVQGSESDDGCTFADNIITLGDVLDTVVIRGSVTTGNTIVAGSLNIVGRQYGFIVSDNAIRTLNTSATSAVTIENNVAGQQMVFSNNTIHASATTSALWVRSGLFSVTGNNIITTLGASQPARAITIGEDTSLSTDQYLLSDNTIEVGTSYGIYIDSSNAIVTDNLLFGSVNNAEITITTSPSKENILVIDNLVNGAGDAGAGNGVVEHQDATPSNVFIGPNKNAESLIVYSPLEGLLDGSWSTTVTLPLTGPNGTGELKLISGSGTNYLIVPLHGLPTGAELESVSLFALGPGSTGDINIRLFKREPTAINIVEVGPLAGADNTALTFGEISVSPLSTEYIGTNNSYMLVITTITAGNEIGQVVAHVRH